MIIKNSGLALYLHIPFCLKKCNYCDFVSFPYRRDRLKKYISCLASEISLSSEKLGINGCKVGAIYLGGGTPSLLQPEDLAEIIRAIKNNFDINEPCEFTMEVNPETVQYNKFKEFKDLGVNRVSLGAQSFNDKTLKILGRVHNSRQIYIAYETLRKAGFENINLDLMFALPGENLLDTEYSLREAINLRPGHISYYSLTIEKGTEFYEKRNSLKLPDDDLDYEEYSKGIEILENSGYTHYEISNFAKPGFESKHNKIYWKNLPYIGFGVSAASYLRRGRFQNTSSLYEYCDKINQNILPVSYSEHLTAKFAKAEHLILNLRLLKDGVDKNLYYIRFGTLPEFDFYETIEKLKSLHLIKVEPGKILLSRKGVFIANSVFTEFLP
ncbi:radical SAM family heme chaperone HemW [bacterium]|nr:radical SAM family heme chaperone HemW [bacterium]